MDKVGGLSRQAARRPVPSTRCSPRSTRSEAASRGSRRSTARPNLLALNAKIEAARAAEGRPRLRGGGRRGPPAGAIDQYALGHDQGQIGSIATGLRDSHGLLQDIATVDVSDESRSAEARVHTVMQTLVAQKLALRRHPAADRRDDAVHHRRRVGRHRGVAVPGPDEAAPPEQPDGAPRARPRTRPHGRGDGGARNRPSGVAPDQAWAEAMIASCTLGRSGTPAAPDPGPGDGSGNGSRTGCRGPRALGRGDGRGRIRRHRPVLTDALPLVG